MGAVNDVIEETVDFLNNNKQRVGLVKVRLYRPFSVDKLLKAIPKTVRKIAVLDRTKEPGSVGEPLYLDVSRAFFEWIMLRLLLVEDLDLDQKIQHQLILLLSMITYF